VTAPTGNLGGWRVVAKREFLERVRTKWFAIVTALGPIFMIGILVLPILLATAGTKSHVEIADQTGKLAGPIASDLKVVGWTIDIVPADTPEATLLADIRTHKVDGFLVLPKNALDLGTIISYEGENGSSQIVGEILRQVIQSEVQHARGIDAGVDGKKLDGVIAPVAFKSNHNTGTGGTVGIAVFFLGYAVMFVLYLAIVLYGANVLSSIITEKTNRVVELMAAAAKPRALMFGKIIGVGGVGLVQVGVWIAMAVVVITFRDPILGLFGASGGVPLPPLTAVDGVVIVTYFVLGYFFYASIFAAIGAMVPSEQDARQAQVPVTFLLVIPMLCISVVSNDPRGLVAQIMTQVPFSAPILMPMRWLLGGASALDALVSIAILAASTWLVAILSARIYRVGILMYGKRASLREVAHWLRHG
jgi:ABC-2 type transport system permease protein